MSHAYIFEGEDVATTKGFALNFAKGLNCTSAPNEEFCDECLSCRTFDSGNHPDTIYVSGTKQKGIGVDDVRDQVLMPMAHKPFRYKYKIFIMEKAETFTPAAQNALLKTIEEPAPYGVFLFIAGNITGFLPTVLSRCAVKRVQDGIVVSAATVDPALINFAEKISAELSQADIFKAFQIYKQFEPYKESKDNLQEILNQLYVIYSKKITDAAASGVLPQSVWLDAAKSITKTKQILKQNGNTQLAIELMLVTLTKS